MVGSMKYPKAQSVMHMYRELLTTGMLHRLEVMKDLSIDHHTFRRYIQEIRSFIRNFGLNESLEYSKADDTYYLYEAE